LNARVTAIFYQAASFLAQLLLVAWVARLLGPVDQGEYALARAGVLYVEAVGFGWLTGGFIYRVARSPRSQLGPAFAWGGMLVILSVGIAVGVWITFGHGVIVASAAWLAATAAQQSAYKLVMAVGRPMMANSSLAITSILALAAVIIGVDLDVAGILAIHALTSLLGFIVLLLAIRADLGRSRPMALRLADAANFVRTGSKGILSAVFYMAMYRLDLLWIELFLGRATVGVYSLAAFTAEMLHKVPEWLATLIGPRFAAREPAANDAWRRSFRYGMIATAVGAGALLILFWGLPGRLTEGFLGPGYEGLGFLVSLLIPKAFLQGLLLLLAARLAGAGYTWWHPGAGAAGLMVLMVLGPLLAWWFGAPGATIALTAATAVSVLVLRQGVRALRLVA
jgi:O-antigen/teichoic acid export membrane protein